MTTSAITLHNDVRIGVQVVVEGEKIDITRFLTLFSLFLELIIPTMLATQAAITVASTLKADISKAWTSLSPSRIRKDLSTLGWGILLLTILIGVLADEIKI